MLVGIYTLDNILERENKSSDANLLVKYALQLNREEKRYLLNRSQASIHTIRALITKANRQLGESTPKFTTKSNKELIRYIHVSIDKYRSSFERYLVFDTKEDELRLQMNVIANSFLLEIKQFIKLQRKQAVNVILSADNLLEIDEFKEVEIAFEVIRQFWSIRLTEKNLLLKEDHKFLVQFKKEIEELALTLNELSKNIERDESKALYFKVFDDFVRYKNKSEQFIAGWIKQETLLNELKLNTINLEKRALALEKDQRVELINDSRKAKNILLIGSITLIFISIVLAVLLIFKVNQGFRGVKQILENLTKDKPLSKDMIPITQKHNELTEIMEALCDLDKNVRMVSLSKGQQNLLLKHLGSGRFVIGRNGEFSHISNHIQEALKSSGQEIQTLLSAQLDFIIINELIESNFLNHTQWPLEDALGRIVSFQFEAVKIDKNHILLIGSIVSNNPEKENTFGKKPTALSLINHSGKFILANEPFRILMDTQGKSLYELTSENLSQQQYCNIPLTVDALKDLSQKDKAVEIIINPNRLEKKRYAFLRAVVLPKNDLNAAFALSCTDISYIRLSEERIHQLAFFDSLTSLPNRANLIAEMKKRLTLAKRQSIRIALLFLDLDEFKAVNDSLGHLAGDELLQEISSRLKEAQREGDFIARLGGDEFCLVTGALDEDDSPAYIAERMISIISKEVIIKYGDSRIQSSCSIGISIFPEDGISSTALLQAADNAMYAAKNDGKNCYRFYAKEMTEKAKQSMQLSQDLRSAIKNNEFELYWQPIIDVEKKSVITLEALVRWQHPIKGMISPNDFIPTIERLGLSGELGRWVVYSACEQWVKWNNESPIDFHIAVNISASHFEETDFIEQIVQCLTQTNIPPSVLDIEITESMTRDVDHHITVCKNLELLNINVSLDDFGTGYSSLGVLRRLGLDWLKIDRVFVEDVVTEDKDQEIISAIVNVANALNVGIIAEGVETIDQLKCLHSLGCKVLQGYYFSKPCSNKDIRLWIENELPNVIYSINA